MRRSAACLAVLAAALWTAPAGAAEAVVRARTDLQFMALRAWRTRWDDTLTVPRQRLLQHLSVYGNDLAPGVDLDLAVTLRVGTELGWGAAEPEALDGVDRHTAELLVGHLRWRDPARGLEVALGRLLLLPGSDFRYVDGVRFEVGRGPFTATAYGGLLVKDGSLLGSPTFEPDGVRSTDDALARREGADWPYELSDFHDAPTPTFGAELGVTPVPGVHARAGWHRAQSAEAVDDERLVAQADVFRGCLEAQGLAEWDLVWRRPSFLELRAGCRVIEPLFAGVQWLRAVPVFDADSIWNSFAIGPLEEGAVLATWRPVPRWALSARGRLRRYLDVVEEAADTAAGGELQARWSTDGGRSVGAMASWLSGWGGDRGWVQAQASWPLARRWAGTLQLAGGWAEDRISTRDGTLIGGARAGLAYVFDPHATIRVYLEENVSRYTAAELRAYLLLDLGAAF